MNKIKKQDEIKVNQIECKNLAIGYDAKIILKDISFSVNSGDYLCIVGENGSGKTTTMKTILGLLPALSGSITLGEGLKHSDIGYLPQQNVVQKNFPASVWEIVLSGCLNHCGLRPFYNKAEKNLARENIKRMGIEHLTKRCYRELSGGQMQRVLLARALSAVNKILLLDEPVSGLDPVASKDLYNVIAGLNAEGITIIMISHDIEGVLDYASHVLHLGKNTFFGTKAEYLEQSGGYK